MGEMSSAAGGPGSGPPPPWDQTPAYAQAPPQDLPTLGYPGYPGYPPPQYPPPPGYPPPGYPPPGYPPPGRPGPYGPPRMGPAPALKPGVIPLRPLSTSDIYNASVSYIRTNPKATLGLTTIVVVVAQMITLALQVGPLAAAGVLSSTTRGAVGQDVS